MLARLRNSRGYRKFTRNRGAMLALAVIAAYTAIFVMVWFFGVLTREDARQRVLPRNTPGWLETLSPEKRFYAMGWYVDSHLAGSIPPDLATHPDRDSVLARAALGERRIIDAPPERVLELWNELKARHEATDNLYLDREDLENEVQDLQITIDLMTRDGADATEIAVLRAELDELRPEQEALDAEFARALAADEAALAELMPMPRGWDGLGYRFRTFLGSNALGQSISVQAFYSIKIAFQIGLVVATACVLIGTVLGSAAGFFGGWIDAIVMWLVSTLSSVPYLVLLAVLSFMFTGSRLFDNPVEHPELQLVKLYVAMGLTFWVGTARVIRGEVMKIRSLEYVQAATAIGLSRPYIVLRHVIPNTFHLMFINFSLLFIAAIKNEVILSFLGLGVSGQPSWGAMISNAKDDLTNYFFWEVGAASVLMFGLVLAFNIVSDAMQDAFDPKHVG